MQEILEYILAQTFSNPLITVTSEDEGGNAILTIHAPKDEIGRIIGKGGKVINAMKQIVKIKAIKENKRVEINVEENAMQQDAIPQEPTLEAVEKEKGKTKIAPKKKKKSK